MDVEEAALPAGHEPRRKKSHVSGQTDEVGPRDIEHAQDGLLVGLAAAVLPPVKGVTRESALPGAGKPRSDRRIRYHRDDLGIRDAPRGDRVRDRLEIRAAPGQQDRDASALLSSSRRFSGGE